MALEGNETEILKNELFHRDLLNKEIFEKIPGNLVCKHRTEIKELKDDKYAIDLVVVDPSGKIVKAVEAKNVQKPNYFPMYKQLCSGTGSRLNLFTDYLEEFSKEGVEVWYSVLKPTFEKGTWIWLLACRDYKIRWLPNFSLEGLKYGYEKKKWTKELVFDFTAGSYSSPAKRLKEKFFDVKFEIHKVQERDRLAILQ